MPINPGQGAVFSFGASAVAQVVEIDGPEATVGTKSTANLASTSMTYRSLLPDGGTVSFTIQYDPASLTHQALQTAINAWPQAPTACTITFNATASPIASFNAIVTRFKPKGMNQEDNLEAEVELKITGLITWPT